MMRIATPVRGFWDGRAELYVRFPMTGPVADVILRLDESLLTINLKNQEIQQLLLKDVAVANFQP
jgi:hypothetical protein